MDVDQEETRKIKFKYRSHVRENKAVPRVVYSVQFNNFLGPNEPLIFASVGGERVFLYECTDDGAMKSLQCYDDPDETEIFQTICWARVIQRESIQSMVVVGGKRGVIRVVDVTQMECVHSFIGHTGSINELKIHPTDATLFLSASGDHSIRLWSITTHACIAIFGDSDAHRDQVLSIDFDRSGNQFASGGMDHSVRIWNLTKPEIVNAIARAKPIDKASHDGHSLPTHLVRASDFVTRDIHHNYVDCVLWFGHFLLTKASHNPTSIKCWRTNRHSYNNRQYADVLHKFEARDSQYWFMRFSLNYDRTMMALGTTKGKLLVWDLDKADLANIVPVELTQPKSKCTMRQPAFSRNGKVLVCGDDRGAIWRWDVNSK